DTQRNLQVFDFVEEHAEAPEFAWSVQQLRPQLLMMQIRAQATLALEGQDHATAIQAVENGIEELKDFFTRLERPDLAEQSGEIQSLEVYLKEICSTRPLSDRERIEKALDDAVRREDYEKAALYRDQLRNLDQV